MIVDDHAVFRNSFRLLLKQIPDIEVIDEATNGVEFLYSTKISIVDMVFMDIKMPEMDGIEATKKAIEKFPKMKIIALTMFGEEEYLLSMLSAGAKGFLLKTVEKPELDKAIQTVLENKFYYSQELIHILSTKKM